MRLDSDTRLYHGVADSPDARAAILRTCLAEQLGGDPSEIAITREDSGKPVLDHPAVPLWFNMAGRDGVVVITTSRRGPVGVDVETIAHCRDQGTVARTLFSAQESEWLASQPEALRDLGFARLWTAKEAVLKARGTGIVQGLAQPDFGHSLTAGPPPWRGVVAQLEGTPYTVAWYSSIVDEAMVITARAQAEAGIFRTS